MKKFISVILVLCVVLSVLSMTSCVKTPSVGGRSTFDITGDYAIVIPENASFTEISAARKLASAIKRVASLDLPIVCDSAEVSQYEIVIGGAKRDGVSLAINNAGENGYSIYTAKNKLFFYGATDRILEIAVERFISEYVIISSRIVLDSELSLTFKDLFSMPDLTLNGVDIAQYKIVYAAEGTTTHYRSSVNAWVESAKYEDAARAIENEIFLLTGKHLTVVSAAESEESDYEILVGKVARSEEVSQFYITHGVGYSDERLAFGMVGTKLLFAGGSPNSTFAASCEFVNECRKMRSPDFTSPLVSLTTDLTKVVCIGSGSTHGSSSTNVNKYNYTVYLQKMLDLDYYVSNLALPTTTAQDYELSSEYQLSLSFAPDVVIMMLGYDDANPSGLVWKTAESREEYVQSITRMVNAYRKANSDVQIYIVSPTYKATSSIWEENLDEVSEALKNTATDLSETFIDVCRISKDESWDFPDGKNLKNEGYEVLAKSVFDAIKNTIKVRI